MAYRTCDFALNMNANNHLERFRTGAAKYAAYLETPDGRLRLDVAFANLQEFLPATKQPLRALDLGGGTGAMAVRLAKLDLHVTLLDASQPMLDLAEGAALQAGVADRITLKHGDAARVADLFPTASFDVVLCHNLLEYLDDPCATLRGAARTLRDTSSIISIVVRNQAGEVLKSAIKDGDLAATERNLTAEWGHESLYGGSVRLFTPESLQATLTAASLEAVAERGVRVLSDYLPPEIRRDTEYANILDFEKKLGRRPELAPLARYTHCLARRAGPDMQDSR
jgi:SAM-dependent methyltransferase